MAEIIAERVLERLTPDGTRPAKVTVYKPVPAGASEWRCRYVASGMKDDGSDIDREGYGVDSVQALFSALYLAGLHFIHTPAVAAHGLAPWVPVVQRTEDVVPLPLATKGLGGATEPPQWLVDLDDAVRALRALRDSLEAAAECGDAPTKVDALIRGMRHLQSSGASMPVTDADIVGAEQLRDTLATATTAPTALLQLVERCLMWWTKAAQRAQ